MITTLNCFYALFPKDYCQRFCTVFSRQDGLKEKFLNVVRGDHPDSWDQSARRDATRRFVIIAFKVLTQRQARTVVRKHGPPGRPDSRLLCSTL